MVFAVIGAIAFRNAARQQAVADNIRTRLAQTFTWGDVIVTTPDSELLIDGSLIANPVIVRVRFNTQAEADSFVANALAAFGSGVNGPTTGSSLTRHDCPHDVGGSCSQPTNVGSW